MVTIEFQLHIDGRKAAEDVREKVAAIRPTLRTEVKEPKVLRFDLGRVLEETDRLLDGSHPTVQGRLRMLEAVQGVLALNDQTDENMGGFQCIPELFRTYDTWKLTQPADRDHFKPDTTGFTPVKVRMEAGDLMILGGPAALGITSISAILKATQATAGQISYVVLGT